ncbi:MAG: PepSY-like domain-containing protein [Muribaculaceae bacterium]|nr:PepSY-like domain-containing protein [Muribaculaceae bacterium]
MKKLATLIAAVAIAGASTFTFAGTPIKATSLPKAAQTFIAKHFPGDTVRKAEKDNGYRGAEYEVDLAGGAEIEFRDNGDWKDVKAARGKAVPAAIVPAAIAAHVEKNYPGQYITEISRKRGGYEVELANGTELKLTEDAKPLPARQGNGNRRR